MRREILAAALLGWAGAALAQSPPPQNTLAYVLNPVATTSLSATTTSSRASLGAAAVTAWVTNTGPDAVCVKLGDNTVVAECPVGPQPATSIIPAGQTKSYGIGAATDIAGITAGGTATLSIQTGYLVPSSVSVVATCGTGAGTPGTITVDINGVLCTDASVATGTFDSTVTAIAALPTLAPGTQRPQGSLAGAAYNQPVYGSASGGGTQVDATHGLPVSGLAYPNGAAPLTATATGTTAATAATLAGTSGKTTYICGFSITSDATAGTSGTAVVSGTISGSLNFVQGVGVAPAVSGVSQSFTRCIPASATNTGIVITSAAAGVGGVTAVSAWGFQL